MEIRVCLVCSLDHEASWPLKDLNFVRYFFLLHIFAYHRHRLCCCPHLQSDLRRCFHHLCLERSSTSANATSKPSCCYRHPTLPPLLSAVGVAASAGVDNNHPTELPDRCNPVRLLILSAASSVAAASFLAVPV